MSIAKVDTGAADLAKELQEGREKLLGEYKITASTATVTKDTTEEGEGEGDEAGAASISASAAVVVLGAMLQ